MHTFVLRLCYKTLNLLLVAIEVKNQGEDAKYVELKDSLYFAYYDIT